MTYTESLGLTPINWKEELEKEDKNHTILGLRAMDWKRCAISNLDVRIPRDEYGKPLDIVLLNLGGRFGGEVFCREYEQAKIILQRIEDRAAELLKEL
jgi:hypothetical protein